jgi:hypothetical protein
VEGDVWFFGRRARDGFGRDGMVGGSVPARTKMCRIYIDGTVQTIKMMWLHCMQEVYSLI